MIEQILDTDPPMVAAQKRVKNACMQFELDPLSMTVSTFVSHTLSSARIDALARVICDLDVAEHEDEHTGFKTPCHSETGAPIVELSTGQRLDLAMLYCLNRKEEALLEQAARIKEQRGRIAMPDEKGRKLVNGSGH